MDSETTNLEVYWRERAEAAVKEAGAVKASYWNLMNAIQEHHAQKADDRCWMDDVKLYAAAGLPYPEEYATVGSCSDMLKNCERFVALRMQSKEGGWKSYTELEAENAELRKAIGEACGDIKNHMTDYHHETKPGDLQHWQKLARGEK